MCLLYLYSAAFGSEMSLRWDDLDLDNDAYCRYDRVTLYNAHAAVPVGG